MISYKNIFSEFKTLIYLILYDCCCFFLIVMIGCYVRASDIIRGKSQQRYRKGIYIHIYIYIYIYIIERNITINSR